MKYINMENCLTCIDENRIDRKHGANIYLMRNSDEIVLEFAYSEAKRDHFILAKITLLCSDETKEEVWQEYLAVSMIIETRYEIRRFVDDVRAIGE